jgi:hypothetical protein
MRTDHNHHSRTPEHDPFGPREDAGQQPRLAVLEVRQLLRQARVHVVQVRHAERGRKDHSDEAAFFVRVDRIVAVRQRPADCGEPEQDVERNLG